MEEQVKELFAAMLREPVDKITDATRPQDLRRWDSLQHMILVSTFEEEFGVSIEPDEAVEMYRDFGTFKRVILQRVNGAV